MSDETKQIDLKTNSVVVPAEVYSRVVEYLVKKFTYADIFSVVNDLNNNAYTVPNEVVESHNPKNVKQTVEDDPKTTKKAK